MNKILIFAMGPGETSQAYAIAKEFVNQGYLAELCLGKEINYSFFRGMAVREEIKIQLTADPESLAKFANSIMPKAIIFCNSKSFNKFGRFSINNPFDKSIPIFTVDSNWLFNKNYKSFKYLRWAKRHYINLPKPVFDAGLKKNGGYFVIDRKMTKKLSVVGLIPSYAKLDPATINQQRKSLSVVDGQKLIFCYFSGFGASSRDWLLSNLITAVGDLRNDDKADIRILCLGKIGDGQARPNYPWITYLGDSENGLVSPEEFYKILSASDLVFQHQGLGTMAQAICAQVPIIANVRVYPKRSSGLPGLHPAEVIPFQKSGVCEVAYKTTDCVEIKKKIKRLLYNSDYRSKMINSQIKCYTSGESELYRQINEEMNNI